MNIKDAQAQVLHGVRAWVSVNEGGDVVLQLNDPEGVGGGPIGAVIMHGVVLHESRPENIATIRAVLRGWVMGRKSAD